MRRIFLTVYLLAVGAGWLLASQVWSAARIIDSQKHIEVSALDAYPQLSVIFVVWLLLVWLLRYFNSGFTKFMLSAVIFLLFSTAAPVWFDSAAGSFALLSPQISKLTGVSDFAGQASLIDSLTFNHGAADFFIISMVLAVISGIALVWLPKRTQERSNFSTRIDKLPSW